MFRLLCCIAVFCSSSAWALQSYRAEYSVSVHGISAGTLIYYAVFTEHHYRITTKAEPSLAARILGINQMIETVEGSISNGVVIPDHYHRSMKSNEKYFLNYDYKYAEQGKIHATVASTIKILNFDADKQQPLDMLSLVVQSMIDDENNIRPKHYTLISGDKLRFYDVKRLPDEILKDGQNKTYHLHVYVQHNHSRQTKIYFAENPCRLVKLQQLNNGKSQFSLNLLNYKAL